MQQQIVEMTELIFKFYPQVRKFFRSLVSIKSLPISMTQIVCIQTVKEQGKIPMSKLATLLQMSNQQLTKVVDNLVEYGMVERYQDENNRRQLLVELNAKGEKTLNALHSEFIKKVTIFTNDLPQEEMDAIYKSLKCIDAYFDKFQSALSRYNVDELH